jgi:hypothetical protein
MNTFNKYLVALCLYALCAAACSKDEQVATPVVQPPPVPVVVNTSLTSFVPATATAGDPVKITGNKFTGATAVMIGNTPAQSFQVVSDTEIMAYVANGGASSGKVSVTAPAGNAEAAGFIYYTPQQSTLAGSVTYASVYAGTSAHPYSPPFDSSKLKSFVVPETISFVIRTINPNDEQRNLTSFFANVKADYRSRFADSANYNYVILTGAVNQDMSPVIGAYGAAYTFTSSATARSSVFAKVEGETITIPTQYPVNGYVSINGSGVIKNGIVVSLSYSIDDGHGSSKRATMVKP